MIAIIEQDGMNPGHLCYDPQSWLSDWASDQLSGDNILENGPNCSFSLNFLLAWIL